MELWEEAVISTFIVVVLLLGVALSVFGVAGFSFLASTGYAVQNTASWSVVYGAVFLAGLMLVYVGLRKVSK